MSAEERKKLKAQETKLLKKHQAEWLGELGEIILKPKKHPEHDWMTLKAKWSFRRGWLHSLELSEFGVEDMRVVARSPALALLERLWLHDEHTRSRTNGSPARMSLRAQADHYPQLFPLLRSRHLGNVRWFMLGEPLTTGEEREADDGGISCHTEGDAAVALVKLMPKLEELHLLAHNVAADELFTLKTLDKLRVLLLYHNHSYPLAKLAANPAFRNLEVLRCHPHAVDDEHPYIRLAQLKAVVRSKNLPALKHLQLRMSDHGDKGAKEIVESGILDRLEVLDLQHGCITDKGAALPRRVPVAAEAEAARPERQRDDGGGHRPHAGDGSAAGDGPAVDAGRGRGVRRRGVPVRRRHRIGESERREAFHPLYFHRTSPARKGTWPHPGSANSASARSPSWPCSARSSATAWWAGSGKPASKAEQQTRPAEQRKPEAKPVRKEDRARRRGNGGGRGGNRSARAREGVSDGSAVRVALQALVEAQVVPEASRMRAVRHLLLQLPHRHRRAAPAPAGGCPSTPAIASPAASACAAARAASSPSSASPCRRGEPMPVRHAIVGSGIAGLGTAEAIRERQPGAAICFVSEEHHDPYSPPASPTCCTATSPRAACASALLKPLEKLGLERIHALVARVDCTRQELLLAGGKRVPYDRLLLATGALATPPPFGGAGLAGAVKLDSLDDTLSILKRAKRGRTAVVVGGGITALELAEGLAARRMKVHYLLRGDRYWADVLDEAESHIVMDRLEHDGIKIRTRTQVKRMIDTAGTSPASRPRPGTSCRASCSPTPSASSRGSTSRRAAGLKTDRGIVVDERMRQPARRVRRRRLRQVGTAPLDVLWPTALDQGRVAGANMAGEKVAYKKEAACNVTMLAGLKVTIIGAVGSARGIWTASPSCAATANRGGPRSSRGWWPTAGRRTGCGSSSASAPWSAHWSWATRRGRGRCSGSSPARPTSPPSARAWSRTARPHCGTSPRSTNGGGHEPLPRRTVAGPCRRGPGHAGLRRPGARRRPAPGSAVGLSFGIGGFVLMLATQTMYSLRKRWMGFNLFPMSALAQGPCLHRHRRAVPRLPPCRVEVQRPRRALMLVTVIVVLSGLVGRCRLHRRAALARRRGGRGVRDRGEAGGGAGRRGRGIGGAARVADGRAAAVGDGPAWLSIWHMLHVPLSGACSRWRSCTSSALSTTPRSRGEVIHEVGRSGDRVPRLRPAGDDGRRSSARRAGRVPCRPVVRLHACHAPAWSKETMADRCLKCHESIGKQIETGTKLHGRMANGRDCKACPGPERGAHAPITSFHAFDHGKTAFPLTGRTGGRSAARPTSRRVLTRGRRPRAWHATRNPPCRPSTSRVTGRRARGCHGTEWFKGTSFSHPWFPVRHGQRRGAEASCADLPCERIEPQGEYTCYGCHKHGTAGWSGSTGAERIADLDNCVKCHAREEAANRAVPKGRSGAEAEDAGVPR